MRLKTIAIASTLCASLLATAALADGGHQPASGEAAKMAYLLAQSSPLLAAARRTAISQDFNGAPLAGKPRVHRLRVTSVVCRVRNAGMEETPTKTHAANCVIDYGRKKTVTLKEPESWDLYEAMRVAGIQDDAGMGHIVRALRKLDCKINDKIAQSTPATGDKVAGFDCRFQDY
jgi:hypothetical protein